jgi:hypothetical protein
VVNRILSKSAFELASGFESASIRASGAFVGFNPPPKGNRVLTATRTLELANVAYSLYVTEKPAEQAELLKNVLLNCSIDAVSISPVYRKPFDMIFERSKTKQRL